MLKIRRLVAGITAVLIAVAGFVALPVSASAAPANDAAKDSVSLTISHFAPGSPKVSATNAGKVKRFIKAHPGYSDASCVGYTMAPVTTIGNQQLALNRAKNVCALADKLSAQLSVTKVSGVKDKKYGAGIRRVVLTLSNPLTSYAVTYSGLNSTSGSAPVDSKSPYWAGSYVTVLGNPGHLARTGFELLGWNTKADLTGATFVAGNQFAIDANTVLYPYWQTSSVPVARHSVTYNSNGATSGAAPVDPNSPYAQGSQVTVLGNTGTLGKTGFTFLGWNTQPDGSGTSFSAGMHFTATIGTVLYAHWVASTFTVTYNYSGGSGPLASQAYIVGQVPLTLPQPYARAGYIFAGWETGTGTFVGNAGDTYSPSANLTLVARWTVAFTVTYNPNTATGTAERASDVFAAGGAGLILPGIGTMTKSGYGLAGWSLSAGTNGAGGALVSSPYVPTGTVTLYAVWVAGAHSVTFDEQGGTSVADTTWVTGGTVLDPGVTSRTGYTFTGWFTVGSGGSAIAFPYAPAGIADIILYAQWTADSHTVTFDTNGGSAVGPGSYLTDGALSDPGSPTKSGYTFGGWSATPGGPAVSFPYSPGTSTPITLYAIWNGTSQNVTFDEQGGSAVTDTTWVTGGTLANPGAPSRAGYTFTGWFAASSGGSALAFPYSPSGSSNITLYAQWTADSHTVTYDSKGGTAVTSGSYLTDGSLTAPSSPTKTGYTFAGWSATDGGPAVTFPYSPGVVTPISLYAVWTADSHNVTFDSKGGSSVTSSTFLSGGNVSQPTAPTKSGYTFAGWSATDGGTAVSFPYSPGVFTDITLYALWTANSQSVTFDEQGGSSVSDTTWTTGGTVSNPGSPTRTGYTFTGWFVASSGGSAISFPYSPSGSASITIYAQWTADSHTVTFDSKGGTAVTGTAFTTGGSFAAPTDPTKSGYTFSGWAATDGGTAVSFPYSPGVTTNVTMYALWTANGGGGGSSNTVSGQFKWVNYGLPCDGTMAGRAELWTGNTPGSPIAYYNVGMPFVQDGIWCKLTWNISSVADGQYYVVVRVTVPGDLRYFTQLGHAVSDANWSKLAYSAAGSGYQVFWASSSLKTVSGGTLGTQDYVYDGGAPSVAVHWQYQNGDPTYDDTFTYGSTVIVPADPTQAGYTFDGWYSLATGGLQIAFPYAPPGIDDVSIYAHWTATGGGGGGSSGSALSGTFKFINYYLPCTGLTANAELWTGQSTGAAVVQSGPLATYAQDGIYCSVSWSLTSVPNGEYYIVVHTYSPYEYRYYYQMGMYGFTGYWSGLNYDVHSGGLQGWMIDNYKYILTSATTIAGVDYTYDGPPPIINFHYSANGGDSPNYDMQRTYGQPVQTIQDPTWAGYTFLGWFTDATSGVQAVMPYTPVGLEEMTLYAHWAAIPSTAALNGTFTFSGDGTSCSLYTLTITISDWETLAALAGTNAVTFSMDANFMCVASWSIPIVPNGKYIVKADVAFADSSMEAQVGASGNADPAWLPWGWANGVATYEYFYAVIAGVDVTVNYSTNNVFN